jgi:hypothetical protein
MLVLVVRKLVPVQEIEEPAFRADAMDGSAVDTEVWSMKEVKWTRAKAGKTTRSLLRGRIFDCRSWKLSAIRGVASVARTSFCADMSASATMHAVYPAREDKDIL